MFHERKKLLASLLLGAETSQHAGCYGGGAGFLDSSHGHTEVSKDTHGIRERGIRWVKNSPSLQDPRCFHDHGDPSRLYGFLDGDGDLFGKPFLDLEAATECLCDASEL